MNITDENMYVCTRHPDTYMIAMYGCGWDYDRFVCPTFGCDFEYELETTTYPVEMEEKSEQR